MCPASTLSNKHRAARRAEADLDDIWYDVAKESGSIEIANRLIDCITSRFFLLASHPSVGPFPC